MSKQLENPDSELTQKEFEACIRIAEKNGACEVIINSLKEMIIEEFFDDYRCAEWCFWYISEIKHIPPKFKKIIEKIISSSVEHSYFYAREIIKNRWELGEKIISSSVEYSYFYACDVIKGRWELGEKIISSNAEYSYLYAHDVIKGRWELGEKIISSDAECSYLYAIAVLKARFKLGEKVIFGSVWERLYRYDLENLKLKKSKGIL